MIFKKSINVALGWRNQYCGIYKIKNKPFYFIDNEYYFKRNDVYGFEDDAERFVFFSKAVLEAIPYLGFTPDLIHCHDWHTAPLILFLKEHYHSISNTLSVFTIHNLKYQGIFNKNILPDLLSLNEDIYNYPELEFFGQVNFMKCGIKMADLVTTVSRTYSEEIKTPFFGEQLDGVCKDRGDQLYGIINGIDYEVYNPKIDKYIVARYGKDTIKNKPINKRHLQELLGLPVNDVPMIAMVSRLVSQKGFDLVAHVLDKILRMEIQMVVLGTGEKCYEQLFINYANKYPDKLSANITFDRQLAHKIYAASDIFLMPSLFEPCGLGQMIALRYGTVPVVRKTGGLKDTIQAYDEISGVGNGFVFENYNAHEMFNTLQKAVEIYQLKDKWLHLMQNAISSDCSWSKSAKKYLELYRNLITGDPKQ